MSVNLKYKNLYRKFILLTLICSLIPLLAVGWIIHLHYARFSKSRMLDMFQNQVENHLKILDLFLQQRCSQLLLITQTQSIDDLKQMNHLNRIYMAVNSHSKVITDIGVIDENGSHLAYIGPYNLMDKNYKSTFWFSNVMQKQLFISDMFMGFRKVPHFIIAVCWVEHGRRWILRATIDTEYFRSLVENVHIGNTGEVYLVNAQGIYQTSGRYSGKIMEKWETPIDAYHQGTIIKMIHEKDAYSPQKLSEKIVAQAWLSNPNWLLVVKQDRDEAFAGMNHANYATLIFLHLSALSILFIAVFITRHMINIIMKQDSEAEQLNRQLMQAGKLASIGELSAGVAHEINNPLAIILTEKQILADLSQFEPSLKRDFKQSLDGSLDQIDIQIQRCKRITHNLLRFSRRTTSIIETIDLNGFILEIIELVEREAKSSGIKFFTELEPDLPMILSDPSQLQQVFLNLITNAIDAHEQKSYGSITINTQSDSLKDGVIILVADTGQGILEEHIDKIFDPFFTTKPVGKGTGLGLSICYSIMKNLGGKIDVKSTPGQGTGFTLSIPVKPPPELMESIGSQNDSNYNHNLHHKEGLQ